MQAGITPTYNISQPPRSAGGGNWTKEFISKRRTGYDLFVLLVLFVGAVGGVFLFGGVRVWSISLLLLFLFSAGILFYLRPFAKEELRTLKLPPGALFIVLFMVCCVARIPFAVVKYEAVFDLIQAAGVLVAYLVWTSLGARVGRWRIVFGLLIFLVTLLCWYALIQQVNGTRFVLNLVRPVQYGMRASASYMCPNHFANLLAMVMCLCLGLSLLRTAGGWLRVLAIYGLVIAVPVLFLTQSRSGWLSAAGGLSVTALLTVWRKNKRLFILILIVLPLIFAVLFGAIWFLSPVARERLEGMNLSSPDGSVGIRFMLWKDTLSMIKDHPLFGHGAGSYRWVYQHYKTHNQQLWARYAHNEYLQALAEYGWVGFLLLGGLALRVVWVMLRAALFAQRERERVLASVVVGVSVVVLIHALFDYNFHIFANVQVYFLITGIAASCLFASGVSIPKRLFTPWWWVISVLMILSCVFLQVQTSRFLASYYYVWKAKNSQQQFQYDQGIAQTQRAQHILPMDWSAYVCEAEMYRSRIMWEQNKTEKQAMGDKAMALYEKAHALNVYDFEIQHGQSVIAAAQGDQDASMNYLRGVLDCSPNELFFLNRYGIQLRLAGRLDEAMKYFQRARKLGGGHVTQVNITIINKLQAAESAKE